MTMRRFFLPTVALSVMLIAPGLAMAEDSTAPTKRDRFELWNECKPIGLIVENLPNHAAEISLTRERIETLVRSRLRAARIYRAGGFSPYLYVNVNMFGRAFSIELNLTKFVTDRISGEKGNAATWIKGSVGIHGRDAGYILQNVSEFTDKFIDEYLRVNAEACNSK